MSYMSSKNLVNETDFLPYTRIGFELLYDKQDGLKQTEYVCPFCKKIYKTNPFQEHSVQAGAASPKLKYYCKHCHTDLYNIEVISGYHAYGSNHCGHVPFLYRFDSIQTVLIGQQFDDSDGHLVAVNGTLFLQVHAVSVVDGVSTYKVFTRKNRVILNMDMRQIYYVNQPRLSNQEGFAHFTLKYASLFVRDDISDVLYRKMAGIAYEKCFSHTLCDVILNKTRISDMTLFFLVKFPVFINRACQLGSYEHDENWFRVLYWLSNGDRSLRPFIFCSDEKEYDARWNGYFLKTFGVSVPDNCSSWFLLTAWQMGHVGFRELSSVYRIFDFLLKQDKRGDCDESILIHRLYAKRTHDWNKLLRRLIKCHGEMQVADMLISFRLRCAYGEFGFYYKTRLDTAIHQLDFDYEDFSLPIQNILTEI